MVWMCPQKQLLRHRDDVLRKILRVRFLRVLRRDDLPRLAGRRGAPPSPPPPPARTRRSSSRPRISPRGASRNPPPWTWEARRGRASDGTERRRVVPYPRCRARPPRGVLAGPGPWRATIGSPPPWPTPGRRGAWRARWVCGGGRGGSGGGRGGMGIGQRGAVMRGRRRDATGRDGTGRDGMRGESTRGWKTPGARGGGRAGAPAGGSRAGRAEDAPAGCRDGRASDARVRGRVGGAGGAPTPRRSGVPRAGAPDESGGAPRARFHNATRALARVDETPVASARVARVRRRRSESSAPVREGRAPRVRACDEGTRAPGDRIVVNRQTNG